MSPGVIEVEKPTDTETGVWILGGIAMYYWYRWIRLGRPQLLPDIPEISIPLDPLLPYLALLGLCCYWYLYICLSWEFVDTPDPLSPREDSEEGSA